VEVPFLHAVCNKSRKTCSRLECTYFPNMFFVSLHSSLIGPSACLRLFFFFCKLVGRNSQQLFMLTEFVSVFLMF
jgi:hypothetical protein